MQVYRRTHPQIQIERTIVYVSLCCVWDLGSWRANKVWRWFKRRQRSKKYDRRRRHLSDTWQNEILWSAPVNCSLSPHWRPFYSPFDLYFDIRTFTPLSRSVKCLELLTTMFVTLSELKILFHGQWPVTQKSLWTRKCATQCYDNICLSVKEIGLRRCASDRLKGVIKVGFLFKTISRFESLFKVRRGTEHEPSDSLS